MDRKGGQELQDGQGVVGRIEVSEKGPSGWLLGVYGKHRRCGGVGLVCESVSRCGTTSEGFCTLRTGHTIITIGCT